MTAREQVQTRPEGRPLNAARHSACRVLCMQAFRRGWLMPLSAAYDVKGPRRRYRSLAAGGGDDGRRGPRSSDSAVQAHAHAHGLGHGVRAHPAVVSSAPVVALPRLRPRPPSPLMSTRDAPRPAAAAATERRPSAACLRHAVSSPAASVHLAKMTTAAAASAAAVLALSGRPPSRADCG